MEKKRSLRQPFPVAHAVLGCLFEGSSYGYRIRQRLDAAFGDLWHIPTSQLYRVLERLEESGWATREADREGLRPERAVYTISNAGRKELRMWIDRATTTRLELVAEFWAKLYFLRRIAPEDAGAWLARQVAGLRGRLAVRESSEAASDDPVFAGLVGSYRESQLETTIAWLEEQAAKGRFG